MPRNPLATKSVLHPRNRHRSRYDFPALIQTLPELAKFVAVNAHGDESIDFADAAAVLALNRAILKHFYGIAHWSLPPGRLCPPIPGRADLIHYVADLLGSTRGGEIPRGKQVRVLDVGVGSSCIYPLIGHAEYGWSFVGSDIDADALASAAKIVDANPGLAEAIELRRQPAPPHIFKGLLRPDEHFDLTICNPPFHASAAEVRAGSERKWKNLGKEKPGSRKPVLNFGGLDSELWTPGGELAFVRRMIEESAAISAQCTWFSSLISKDTNLQPVYLALEKAKVHDFQAVEMAQGQKKSRIVAWTFQK